MYLGWYDPDKKRPVTEKVGTAMNRYIARWGTPVRVVITNECHAADLWGSVWDLKLPDGTDNGWIEIRPAAHIPPNTFFVGEDEPE